MLKHKSPYYAYLLSKKALYELTKMSALELAPSIRVNAVALGLIDSDRLRQEYSDLTTMKQQTLPLRSIPKAEEAIHAIMHLIEHQSYTGQCLYVDGGVQLLLGEYRDYDH